jgi:hypothetical protein
MALAARRTQYQVIHEVSMQFDYTKTQANPSSYIIGVIPRDAILHAARMLVPTFWGFSTTVIATLGVTPGGAELLTDDLKSTGRTDTICPAINAGPLAADTPIYLTVNYTGGPPNSGLACGWVEYIPRAG